VRKSCEKLGQCWITVCVASGCGKQRVWISQCKCECVTKQLYSGRPTVSVCAQKVVVLHACVLLVYCVWKYIRNHHKRYRVEKGTCISSQRKGKNPIYFCFVRKPKMDTEIVNIMWQRINEATTVTKIFTSDKIPERKNPRAFHIR
jgi:hypothetical protein